MSHNVFIVGLDAFHRRLLQTIRGAEDYRFHALLDYDEVVNPARFDMQALIDQGLEELERFQGSVDAIIGHWDFPTTALLPVYRERYGLPGPGLDDVLVTEHKYWGRLRQQQAVPECVPAFQAVDPFADDAAASIELDYPFWLKPVIAFSSQLAFYIGDDDQLKRALEEMRAGIDLFGEPFKALRERTSLPEDIPAHIDAFWAIAEKPVGGKQCTAEGYIFRGEPHVYGIVDSYREGRYQSSFSRYQLPSRLPRQVKARIVEYCERVVPALGLDDTPFNIEFFWDAKSDRIWLLEVNPRISKSHSPLFLDVHGASHHEVAVDIELGREPQFPRQEGCCAVAAKFMLRRYHDAVVTRVPTREELEALEHAFPGTYLELAVSEGMRLSELRGQDAYSYEVLVAFMGASDPKTLLQQYERLKGELPLEFDEAIVAEVS